MQNENTGHIVRFYKRLVPIKSINPGSHFDYIAFMNYDGAKIGDVTAFKDYQNIVPLDKEEFNRVLYHMRQKVFLYSLLGRTNSRILYSNSIPDQPIMTIAFVDVERSIAYNNNINKVQDYLVESMEKLNIKFEIFGTLCTSDFAIVMRSNEMSTIMDALYMLRSLKYIENATQESKSLISSTYAVPCFDIENIANLADCNAGASIRISFSDKYQPEEVHEKLKEAFPGASEPYFTFGKFDMEQSTEISSWEEFVRQYLGNDGILSSYNEFFKENIVDTNTSFFMDFPTKKNKEKLNSLVKALMPLKVEPMGDEDKKNNRDKQKQTLDSLECIINNIKNNDHMSQTVESAVIRLLLRAYQAAYTNWEFYRDAVEAVLFFAKLVRDASLVKTEAEITTMTVVDKFNTLFDNQVVASGRDFELPQGNIRFTRYGAKILVAYTNLVRTIYKVCETSQMKHYAFVTADTVYETTAIEVHHNKNPGHGQPEEFLWNYSIPFDAMYNPWAVCFLLHEAGHGRLQSYSNSERFGSFWMVAVYALAFAYHKISPSFELNTTAVDSICNQLIPEGFKPSSLCNSFCKKHEQKEVACELKLDKCPLSLADYAHVIFRYMRTMLSDCTVDEKHLIRVEIREHYVDFINHYAKILFELSHAYDEAVADVFMLDMLQITDPNKYIDIMNHFLKSRKAAWENYENGDIRRVIAVLMMLSKDKTMPEIIMDIRSPKAKICLETKYAEEWQCNKLLEWELSNFLKTHVQGSLAKRLNGNPEFNDLKMQLRKAYENISKEDEDGSDSFNASIELISHFYYNPPK